MIQLDALRNIASAKIYKKGSAVVRDGDGGDEMYLIINGQVDMFKNYGQRGEIHIATMKQGDFFGEMTLFLERKWPVDVIARNDVILLMISRDKAVEFIRQAPELVLNMIKTLCTRLDSAGEAFEDKNERETIAPIRLESEAVYQKNNITHDKPVYNNPVAAREEPEPSPSVQQAKSSLFPEGHGNYTLEIDNSKTEYFLDKTHTCPLCRNNFKSMAVKEYKLVNDHTDPDMRVHYRDVEPLNYDIVICPKCWYSALADSFEAPVLSKPALNDALLPYKSEFTLKESFERDIFTVFAGYYLAMLCVGLGQRQPKMTTCKLWVKLSRLYADCGDKDMEKYATQRALEDYLYMYEKTNLTNEQAAQVCLLIGEFYLKLGDLNLARKFFFQVKTDRSAGGMFKRQAETRIEDIRDLLAE